MYKAITVGNGLVTALLNTGCTEYTSNTIKVTFYVTFDILMYSLYTKSLPKSVTWLRICSDKTGYDKGKMV